MRWWLQDKGVSPYYAGKAGDAVGFLPGLGNATAAHDMARDYSEGDNVGAATNAAGIALGPLAKVAGPAVKAIFGGVMAKTANLGLLDKAKEMLSAGHSKENIIASTGWFQGNDGKWRFEIPDTGAKAKLVEGPWFSGTVGDVLEHDALYKAYPELEDTTFMGGRYGGTDGVTVPSMHVGKTNYISTGIGIPQEYYKFTPLLNNQIHLSNPQKGTMLHELQHAVQLKEGFDLGTNPDAMTKRLSSPEPSTGNKWSDEAFSAYKNVPGEVEARNVEARWEAAKKFGYGNIPRPWQTEDVPAAVQKLAGDLKHGKVTPEVYREVMTRLLMGK